MNIDIRQSSQYARFMNDIGWHVERLNSTYIYLKKFPILGNYGKIPRPNLPLSLGKIIMLKKKYNIFMLKIAPNILVNSRYYLKYKKSFLASGYKIDQESFIPTATIWVDLTVNESRLFNNLSEAKRRAARRAIKLGVRINLSSNIDLFVNLYQKQYFPLGMFFNKEVKKLWQNFYPKNALLLLAFNKKNKPFAGVLLLYYKDIAYYWLATSTGIGKKLYAPTLLVWKALCHAKEREIKIFDFEGIYDERFPKTHKSWRGFTRFKKGFGGKVVNYMENFQLKNPVI